ncbi:unnamed protein product [Musa textilis]
MRGVFIGFKRIQIWSPNLNLLGFPGYWRYHRLTLAVPLPDRVLGLCGLVVPPPDTGGTTACQALKSAVTPLTWAVPPPGTPGISIPGRCHHLGLAVPSPDYSSKTEWALTSAQISPNKT